MNKIIFIPLISLLFISCSNMTIGLEEDSLFYNGPFIDTRPDKTSKDKNNTKKETNFVYERDDE